jgi:hypothetical protein
MLKIIQVIKKHPKKIIKNIYLCEPGIAFPIALNLTSLE